MPLLYLSPTTTLTDGEGIHMTPSRIGPGGSDGRANPNDDLNGGASGSARSKRPDDSPRRIEVTGPLGGVSRHGAASGASRREAAKWLAGKSWTAGVRGFTKTRAGLSTAKNSTADFLLSFGIDRRAMVKGTAYVGAAIVAGEATIATYDWLKSLIEPPPLPVPDDVPASAERIAQARTALFAAGHEEANQVIASLSRPSPALRRDHEGVRKQQDAILSARDKGGEELIEALDRYWTTDIGKNVFDTDADRGRNNRLRVQIAFLELRPETGESKSETTERREALKNTVHELRVSDWTCQPGKDRTIVCNS